MVTWPSTLPQTPLLEGYSDVPQNSVLRSDFDGYTKQRNRFTAVINDVEERYYFTSTQYVTFKDFYANTLSQGSIEFLKDDPETGLTQSYRFVEPYNPQKVGLDWIVTLRLEKLT